MCNCVVKRRNDRKMKVELYHAAEDSVRVCMRGPVVLNKR